MRDKEYIAYQGIKCTVEWYFTEKGSIPALDYYNSLDKSQRIKVLYLLKRMGDIGKINDTTKFNNEGDKIFAFKPKPDRFLCFFERQAKLSLPMHFVKNNKSCRKLKKKEL